MLTLKSPQTVAGVTYDKLSGYSFTCNRPASLTLTMTGSYRPCVVVDQATQATVSKPDLQPADRVSVTLPNLYAVSVGDTLTDPRTGRTYVWTQAMQTAAVSAVTNLETLGDLVVAAVYPDLVN